MPKYPGFTHVKQFVVSVVDSCANPTITGAVTETQDYLITHSALSWALPPTVRAHDYCTYTFTHTASIETGRSLPQFIKFDNDNKLFTVFTKDVGLAGLYKIRLNAFVNDASQTPAGSAVLNLNAIEIKYAVKENTAPYFREPLKELSIDSGSTI